MSEIDGADLFIKQNERILEASGASQEEIDQQLDFVRQTVALTLAGDWDGLRTVLTENGVAQIEALPEDQRAGINDPATFVADRVAQQLPAFQHWYAFFFAYDPRVDLEQLTVPMLALFGDKDVQVDADQNATALQAIVDEAGLQDVTIVRFPTANHLFQDAVTGSPDEYATLDQTFIPDLLPTITDWIAARFG